MSKEPDPCVCRPVVWPIDGFTRDEEFYLPPHTRNTGAFVNLKPAILQAVDALNYVFEKGREVQESQRKIAETVTQAFDAWKSRKTPTVRAEKTEVHAGDFILVFERQAHGIVDVSLARIVGVKTEGLVIEEKKICHITKQEKIYLKEGEIRSRMIPNRSNSVIPLNCQTPAVKNSESIVEVTV